MGNIIRNFLLGFLLLLSYYEEVFINSKVIKYLHKESCKSHEYFDTNSFTCKGCDFVKNLMPSEDHLSCECNKQSKLTGYINGTPICEVCEVGTIPTMDGRDCISCRKGIHSDNCSCPSDNIRVETNLSGVLLKVMECLPCSENSVPSIDRKVCLPCSYIESHWDAICNCHDESYIKLKQNCILRNNSLLMNSQELFYVNFWNHSVESYYLRDNLNSALYLCERGPREKCEHLSNICALTLYSNEAACNSSLLISDSIFYESNQVFSILYSKNISQRYNLQKNNNNSQLEIRVAKYSLAGKFKSFDRLSFFGIIPNIEFGVNIHKKLKMKVDKLRKFEMKFLKPYLVFNNKNEEFFHPLPILVKQLNKDEKSVKKWRLVKKYFPVDAITGFRTINLANSTLKIDPELSGLRYMKSLEILVKIRSEEDHGKIFPPLFIIDYEELSVEEILNNEQIFMTIRISFHVPEQGISKIIQIIVGILAVFALFLSFMKTWSFSRRNLAGKFKLTLLLWFIIHYLSLIGNILLLISIATCACVFVFYKGQTVLHILLPNNVDESTIHWFTTIGFSLKTLELISNLVRQWSVDLFFIDWEQPRRIHNPVGYHSPRTSLKRLFKNKGKQKGNNSSNRKKGKCSRLNENARMSVENSEVLFDKSKIENGVLIGAPVSAWRSLFIVNKYYEIQTSRRTSIILQTISTFLILEIIGLRKWSITVPDLRIERNQSWESEENYTLRFGIGAIVYIIVYLFQCTIFILLYEIYVGNRIQHFVNLCSTANISLFIFHYKYYGFYIHGRSVSGFADTDLKSLMNDLDREGINLSPYRGLIPGTNEQTFTLSLTTSFREVLDEASARLHLKGKNSLNKRYTRLNNYQKTLLAHDKIKEFLRKFVDHCYQNPDYIIKEKLFLERLCDFELTLFTENSVFYKENIHSFDYATFYGNESLLAAFEIAIFVFAQALLQDYLTSLLITLSISTILSIINKWNVKRNLIRKTFINNYFLV